MLPQLDFNSNRKYLNLLRRLWMGTTAASIFQLGFMLFGFTSNSFATNATILSILIIISTGSYSFYLYKIKNINSPVHTALYAWAKERYDLSLDNKTLQDLATPSKITITDVEGYCSEVAILWTKDEIGKNHAHNLRLFQVDNEWIIYLADEGEEYPLKLEKDKENSETEFFENLWAEVKEARGFYSLSASGGEGFISGQRDGKLLILFWSDSLRAQLWANAQQDLASVNWEPVFVPLEFFRDNALPQIAHDGHFIGLNWDEEMRFFDPSLLRSLVTMHTSAE